MRLLLCGSAMSVMGRLLAGQAPLRGRAGLEMLVQPFPYAGSSRSTRASVCSVRRRERSAHLNRLAHARDLLAAKGYETDDTVLACYSAAGFEKSLRAAAGKDRSIALITPASLYEG